MIQPPRAGMPRVAERSAAVPGRGWVRFLVAVATAATAAFPVAAAAWVVTLDRAAFAVAADPATPEQRAAEAPPAGARWGDVRLPHRWQRSEQGPLAVGWYRLAVDLPPGSPEDAVLYVPRIGSGGTVFVNGVHAASVRGPDEHTQVRWAEPHLLPIEARMLRPGRNEIAIRMVTRDADRGLSELSIGPRDELYPVYRRHHLLIYDTAQMSAAFTAITGAFMLAIWWYRRSERLYLYFGIGCLSWAMRTLPFVVQVVPYDFWWAWRAFYFLSTGLFTMAMGAFFLEQAGLAHRRWNVLMVTYSLIGPVLVLASGGALEQWVLRYWQALLFVFMAWALWCFGRALWRRPTVDGWLLAGAVTFAVVLAAIDFAATVGMLGYTRYLRLHLGAPVLLVAMGAILAVRFVKALQVAERANVDLARSVAEKERELAHQYERLREVERRQAVSAERQRIMQDIHDGLGSQLVSSLMLVEQGRAAPEQIATLLREAIDDMRLAIDGLGTEDAELSSALASLRYRMEPRLRAAGIDLHWRVDAGEGTIPMQVSAALQVLRLVQEALSNAVRHSGASRIAVSVERDGESLRVAVADNGRGFDEANRRPGKGLSNMRRRARELGAALSIRSGDTGTTVSLEVPLGQASGS